MKNQVYYQQGETVGNRRKNPFYSVFYAMINRCYKESNIQYHNYGGRGIKVCKRWLIGIKKGNNKNSGSVGFINFCKDMGERPIGVYKNNYPKYTLDRTNNNLNYSPKNCIWSNIRKQQSNRRNNNETVGVSYDNKRDKWFSSITFNRKHIMRRFDKKIDAIKYRKKLELQYE
jgi:hypothetical protein